MWVYQFRLVHEGIGSNNYNNINLMTMNTHYNNYYSKHIQMKHETQTIKNFVTIILNKKSQNEKEQTLARSHKHTCAI